MNANGNPASLVAAHPGNNNARTHGIFDLAAREVRAAEFAERLLDDFGDGDPIVEAWTWETARMMAQIERLDCWLADLDGPPPQRQKYLLDERTKASRQLMKLLLVLEERRAASAEAPAVLARELADQVAALERLAWSPLSTDETKLGALRLLTKLGVNGTAAGALAEDQRRREGSMTREFHGRRHVKGPGGTWHEAEAAE